MKLIFKLQAMIIQLTLEAKKLTFEDTLISSIKKLHVISNKMPANIEYNLYDALLTIRATFVATCYRMKLFKKRDIFNYFC